MWEYCYLCELVYFWAGSIIKLITNIVQYKKVKCYFTKTGNQEEDRIIQVGAL